MLKSMGFPSEKNSYVGEDGFTSLPQDILIMTLANEEDTKEKIN